MDIFSWQLKEYTAMKPGLERITEFLDNIGNPHKDLKVVHIAGTNGKGSTSKIIAHILARAGYKTGLYTSPHLKDVTERIQINSVPISKNRLKLLARMYLRFARINSLTFFEYLTAIALIYFARNKTDIAVLETGLGGRFDATNIFYNPLVSVITDIDYDHTSVLGNTIDEIAKEKCGIIKINCPVISGVRNLRACRLINNISKARGSVLYQFGNDFNFTGHKTDWNGRKQYFRYNGINDNLDIELSLLGAYQARNCSTALAAIELLKINGITAKHKHIKNALKNIAWPGRFDVRNIKYRGKNLTLILDGMHNPGAAKQFGAALRESPYGKRKLNIIFGVLKDKDFKSIIGEIFSIAEKVFIVPIHSLRNLSSRVIGKCWEKYLPKENIFYRKSVPDAVKSLSVNETALITGSLYLVGETLKHLKLRKNKH